MGIDTPKNNTDVSKNFESIKPVIVTAGNNINSIFSNFGIKQSAKPEWLTDIHPGDKFEFFKNKDNGTGMLHYTTNGRKVTIILNEKQIFQDIEEGPKSFPSVRFYRIQGSDTYTLTGKNGMQLSRDPIVVPTAQIDSLRNAIDEISGSLIAECGARKAEYELMCEIKPVEGFEKTAIRLNSANWYDFIPTNISMDKFAGKTRGTPNQVLIGVLVRSLYPELSTQTATK